jgi:signal peptidase
MNKKEKEKLSQFYAKFYFRLGSMLKWPIFIVLIVIIAVGLLLMISGYSFENRYNIYAIETESMLPTLPPGELIITKKQKERYQIEDIISYKLNPKDRKPITHRITDVGQESITIYKTKGDNNDLADPYDVTEKHIVGKVVYHLPYLGNLVLFSRSVEGIILLFIIPITILLTLNAQSIYRWLEKIAYPEGRR